MEFARVVFTLLLLLLLVPHFAIRAERNVFILGGQSNMVGLGGYIKFPNGSYGWDGVVPPECEPKPQILRFNSTSLSWEEAREPLHGAGIGPGFPFAHSILERNPATGEIGLIPCAVGGTSIVQWARGSELYNTTLSHARAAGGVVRGLLWYQGESDTFSLEAANQYKGRFQQILSDFRMDLALPSLPVVEVAIISGNLSYIDIVRAAQIQSAAEVPNVKCVDAMGLQLGADQIHLTTAAQVQLGKMMADAYLTIGNVTSAPSLKY